MTPERQRLAAVMGPSSRSAGFVASEVIVEMDYVRLAAYRPPAAGAPGGRSGGVGLSIQFATAQTAAMVMSATSTMTSSMLSLPAAGDGRSLDHLSMIRCNVLCRLVTIFESRRGDSATRFVLGGKNGGRLRVWGRPPFTGRCGCRANLPALGDRSRSGGRFIWATLLLTPRSRKRF